MKYEITVEELTERDDDSDYKKYDSRQIYTQELVDLDLSKLVVFLNQKEGK